LPSHPGQEPLDNRSGKGADQQNGDQEVRLLDESDNFGRHAYLSLARGVAERFKALVLSGRSINSLNVRYRRHRRARWRPDRECDCAEE